MRISDWSSDVCSSDLSDEYMKVYNILFGVAVFVMLGFFMLQVIGGMIRREPAAMTRAVTGLAKSILGSFVAITLLALALEITDPITIGIVNAAVTNIDRKSVGKGKRGDVRVKFGCRRNNKKKK